MICSDSKLYWFFSSIIILFCMVGCKDDIEDGHYGEVYMEYFIQSYWEFDRMSVYGVRDTVASLDLRGKGYSYKNPDPVNRACFREYAEHFGDADFKRKVPFLASMELKGIYVWDIDALDVRSDRAWDQTHPAGSPLDDVIWVRAFSYGPYVRSGYQGVRDTEIYKPLGELKKGDLSMIEIGSVSFCFPEPPADRDEHRLMVTLAAANGVMLTTSFSLKPLQ